MTPTASRCARSPLSCARWPPVPARARCVPEDIEGSTFSISNLGMFDVEHFIAIINPPEAAILAVGSARQVPVVKDGQVVPGWRMKATISVDHRVSDGAEAARFLQALAPYLEEPVQPVVMKTLFEKTRYLSLIAVCFPAGSRFEQFHLGRIKTY